MAAQIGPLPGAAFSATGQGVTGAAVGDGYRVTAGAPTVDHAGVRWAVDYPFPSDRGFTLELTVERSAGTLGILRLVAYWIVAEYGQGEYGSGPYGGGIPFDSREVAGPSVGGVSTYQIAGIPPEGTIGLAFELVDAYPATSWPAGSWLQVTTIALFGDNVTARPRPELAPVPHVALRLDDLDELGAETATVYAITASGERPVRGAWRTPVSSVFVVEDFLAPFGVPIEYAVRLHDAAGADLQVLTATSAPIEYEGTIVQHVLDPYLSTEARLLNRSESSLSWGHDGVAVRPGSARYPTWIGSGRWPLRGVPLVLGTETEAQESAMRGVFALDSDADHLPIVAIRTSHRTRWPQPFQVVVPEVQAQGIDWRAGGFGTHWHMTADEVQPPSIALSRPGVTWQDVMAVYPTWDALRAAYATWGALVVDTSLAGAADA